MRIGKGLIVLKQLKRLWIRLFGQPCWLCGKRTKNDYHCDECEGDLLLCQELDYYGRYAYVTGDLRKRLESKGLL